MQTAAVRQSSKGTIYTVFLLSNPYLLSVALASTQLLKQRYLHFTLCVSNHMTTFSFKDISCNKGIFFSRFSLTCYTPFQEETML